MYFFKTFQMKFLLHSSIVLLKHKAKAIRGSLYHRAKTVVVGFVLKKDNAHLN
jgi:hypothetical protein